VSGIGAVGSSGSQISGLASQVTSTGTASGGPTGGSLIVALLFDPNLQASSPNAADSSVASSSSSNSSTGLTDLRQQIDAAVANAIQAYDSGANSVSNSGGTAPSSTTGSPASGSSAPDILQSIADAITQTLQKNGIDPQQLQQAGQASHHRHHHHHSESGSESSSQTGSGANSPADAANGSQTDASGGAGQQGFSLLVELLQTGGANSTGTGLASNLTGGSSSQSPSLTNLVQLLGNLPAGSNLNAEV